MPTHSSHAQPCPGDCDISGDITFTEIDSAVSIAIDAASVATCMVADNDNDGEVHVDEIVAAVNRVTGGCAVQQQAFVLASDFQTGSFATVSLAAPREVAPTSSQRRVGSDSVVRRHGNLLYVLNRFLANNIQAFDSADSLRPLYQCSTGPGTNPQDIAVVDSQKAYVTAYESAKLLIINPSPRPGCGDFVRGFIDLAEFADADGVPEMDQMVIVGNRLYVALQQLDRRNFFVPARNARIVEIDLDNDRIVGAIELTGGNPFSATKGLTLLNGDIVVSEVGQFGVDDGGIERVNLKTRTPDGFLITEATLGGDITDFVILSEHLAYAAVSRQSSTLVLAFDPTEQQVIRTVYDRGGFVPDIEINDRGELYIADRTFNRPGLRIYRAKDGVELTSAVLPIGLPPFDMVFLP